MTPGELAEIEEAAGWASTAAGEVRAALDHFELAEAAREADRTHRDYMAVSFILETFKRGTKAPFWYGRLPA